jgi:hypothetical protein
MRKGIYRHYKGKMYEVLDEAMHSETMEPMVIYRALYGNFDLWVRPKDMFLEKVQLAAGEVPRFEYVRETINSH